MSTGSLTKNLVAISRALAPRPVITWDRAERIRRNEEIFNNRQSIVHRLPEHYKKRYWQNVMSEAEPVHYRPPTSRYQWDSKRLVVIETENYPIIGYQPPEADRGLWGGETVVKGYAESKPYTKKKILPRHWIPRFYFPELKRVVLYSEILDKHMTVVVTERACRKIDECFGLDPYLLETPEIDIASKLGLRLKREILLTLARGSYYSNNPERHEFIRRKYAKHIMSVEEAEWVGLDLNEACRKLQDMEDSLKPEPEKYRLERELVQRLAEGDEDPDHEQLLKELETEMIIAEKAKNVMQTTTTFVSNAFKKVVRNARSKLG